MTVWLFDEESFVPVAMLKEGRSYSILTDQLGTPTEAYDTEGNEVWSRVLDMDGNVIGETGNKGMVPFLFQGQYYDRETGLAYNRFRYYSPQMGMYISQDPIGLASGILNLYGYVKDTCWLIDPLGLKTYRRKNGRFGKKPGRKSKANKIAEIELNRRKGVKEAWRQEQAMVRTEGYGTRQWSPTEIKELLETGKVSGYEGHHINSVSSHPELASDPNNIVFKTKEEHLMEHNGDFHNPTSGELVNRI
ncbi:hypothetical protein DW176_23755 [Bacteroides fragilis]|nr:hypothetical protein DW176_23755 [Bacteroides fragilis]RHI25951.1 hypothetical protein DW170_23750 [Bacteroides fragilis]